MSEYPQESFVEYQKNLLDKGIAISAACSHECYGKIIFNQIIKSPSYDLRTTMREKVSEALSERCQEINQE